MSLIKLDASVLTLLPYNYPDYTAANLFKRRDVVHTLPELIQKLYDDSYDIISVNLNSILESPLYTTTHFISAVNTICKSAGKLPPKIIVYAKSIDNIPLIRELIDAGYHGISMHTELLQPEDKVEIGNRLLKGEYWLDPISEELLRPISSAKRRQNKLSKAILEGRTGYFVCPLIESKTAELYSLKLKNDLNLTCKKTNTLQELFAILATPTNQVDIIWIDAETIANYKDLNYIDIVNTLVTLLKITGRINKTHISIAVGKSTPVELIKEIIKTNGVNSIALRAGDYSYELVKPVCEKILQGKSFVADPVKTRLKNKMQRKQGSSGLTTRQKQIVDLIIDTGPSNKVIARKLQITESAVKRQVTDILRKTKTKNRTQLALMKKEKVTK